MKRVLTEKTIMNKDVLKLNQLVSIVSNAHYLHKNLENIDEISRYKFVELLVRNFYLDGFPCWQNKELDGNRTYIEVEELDGKLRKFEFINGFIDFNLSYNVDIYNNQIYLPNNSEVIDDVFNLILDGQHLYIDTHHVISNSEDYDGWLGDDNKWITYPSKLITEKILYLNRFI